MQSRCGGTILVGDSPLLRRVYGVDPTTTIAATVVHSGFGDNIPVGDSPMPLRVYGADPTYTGAVDKGRSVRQEPRCNASDTQEGLPCL